jgi:hypothetical protein
MIALRIKSESETIFHSVLYDISEQVSNKSSRPQSVNFEFLSQLSGIADLFLHEMPVVATINSNELYTRYEFN